MNKKLMLGEYGPHLWTRERAREIRVKAEKLLRELKPGESLVIDAQNVEVFDFSFANELFGKLLLNLPREYLDRFLIIENLTTYTRENLAKALESLNLAAIERTGGKLKLIGKLHPVDQETFAAIEKAGEPITATILKERLGINLTAMNERLTKLAMLGVIRREKGVSPAGREQYVYSVPGR